MSGGNAEIWLMSHQSSNKEAKEPTTTNQSKKRGIQSNMVLTNTLLTKIRR